MITLLQLNKILPYAKNVTEYIDPINETLVRFGINTTPNIAHFLAQVGYESGQLQLVERDGGFYRGRGLIPIQGRQNYEALTDDLPPYDFIEEPELLIQPRLAALSAGWFWNTRRLNNTDLKHSTLVINGDYNGLEDRKLLYLQARKVLKC